MAESQDRDAARWPQGVIPSFSDPELLAALEAAPADAFDDLPFGLITMDRHGSVLHYNADESHRSGLTRDRVLGRNFFDSVGPCTQNDLVAGRYAEARATGRSLDEELTFTFTFRMRPTPVHLRMLAAAGSSRQYLAVQER